jgi:hypothetical protein
MVDILDGACSKHPDGCPELAHTEGAQDVIVELLVKGAHLVEDALMHMSHGEPTIEQALVWLEQVRRYVSLGTISVRVG